MSEPLYQKELLRLAADAHGAGKLAEPKVSGHAHNPLCGDKVSIELHLDRGNIAAIAQESKACVLTQASASLLARDVTGAGRAELERLKIEVLRMLEGNAPPLAPFEAYSVFESARPYPSRHRCVLLPLEAALAAFDASEAP